MSNAGPRSPGWAERLAGRDTELGLIRSFLAAAAAGGGALLLAGEPGVGKTALLEAAASAATETGFRVVRAAGTEYEAGVSFSGLNQLLLPLLEDLSRLDGPLREPLSVALGLAAGSPADRLVLANAVLALLRQAGNAGPVLMVVDDLPWIDRPSALALGLVARRLAGTRVGLHVAVSRSGERGLLRAQRPARA